MIIGQVANSCIICGKARVIVKTWKVKDKNGSVIVNYDTECPDKSCQAKVRTILQQQRNTRMRQEEARAERLANLTKNRRVARVDLYSRKATSKTLL